MRVKLLYFAVLKDILREAPNVLELPEGETVGGLLRLLHGYASKQSGEMMDLWGVLAVAVNKEYASADSVLQDGDEVALLPPVSGGSDESAR